MLDYFDGFSGIFSKVVVQGSFWGKMLHKEKTGVLFYPVMKMMVQVSKEGTSEAHRWVLLPKVYFCIVYCLKLVKKQGKTIGTCILQLYTVDSNF